MEKPERVAFKGTRKFNDVSAKVASEIKKRKLRHKENQLLAWLNVFTLKFFNRFLMWNNIKLYFRLNHLINTKKEMNLSIK